MHAFDVLGDPVRRRILELLAEGERTSGQVVEVIQAEFGISQSAVSQQLGVLRQSGFATVRAEGTLRKSQYGHFFMHQGKWTYTPRPGSVAGSGPPSPPVSNGNSWGLGALGAPPERAAGPEGRTDPVLVVAPSDVSLFMRLFGNWPYGPER